MTGKISCAAQVGHALGSSTLPATCLTNRQINNLLGPPGWQVACVLSWCTCRTRWQVNDPPLTLLCCVPACVLCPAGLLTIEKGVPNLTGLFSLQNVTPIHVAPAVWLGLHWKGLRGEAVVAGMISGKRHA